MGSVSETITRGIVETPVVNGADVGTTPPSDDASENTLALSLTTLRENVEALKNAGTRDAISQSFNTFQASFTINSSNITLWQGISGLYTAIANQNVIVNLPTAADITAASVPYPVRFEFTHLGGTARDNTNTLILSTQPLVADEEQIQTRASGLQDFTTLRTTDGVLLEKASISDPWIETRFAVDPSETLLPSGLFTLRNDVAISDITQIAVNAAPNGLNGVTIAEGDAFLVATGGGGTYFGTTIDDGDVIVADKAAPSLLTSSTDWLIVRNTNNAAVAPENQLLLSNFVRSGVRFDGNANVFVNEANVIIETNAATNLPPAEGYTWTENEDGSTTQSHTFSTPAGPTFAALVGGKLSLNITLNSFRQVGFAPTLTAITFVWTSAAITFTFPLTNVGPLSGTTTIDITIPNVDYSAIFATAPDSITLTGDLNGKSFFGEAVINSLINSNKGTLHDSVEALAATASANVVTQVNTQIEALRGETLATEGRISDLVDRVSPLRTRRSTSIDTSDAYFLEDPTGSTSAPTSLTGLVRIDPNHGVLVLGGSVNDLFIAVSTQHRHQFVNNTTGFTLELSPVASNGDVNVDLVGSFTDVPTTTTYFVFEVTNVAPADSVSVFLLSSRQVIAWQDDIDGLKTDVSSLRALFAGRAILNLAEGVESWLKNDVSIGTSTSLTPSALNMRLDHVLGVQFAFLPQATPAISGVIEPTTTVANSGTSPRRGRRLLYLPMSTHAEGGVMLRASTAGGGALQTLLQRIGNTVAVHEFVAAVPSGVRNVTRFPFESNGFGGSSFVFMKTSDRLHGSPRSEDQEIFYTRSLPLSATTMTLEYRRIENSDTSAEASFTLANAGGSSDVSSSVTVSLPNGGEILLTMRWQASFRRLRVSAEVTNEGTGFFLTNMEVRASWVESVDTPSRDATTTTRRIADYIPGDKLPVLTGFNDNELRTDGDITSLIIGAQDVVVETGFDFNALFGNLDDGFMEIVHPVAPSVASDVYDWNRTDSNTESITLLYQARNQPYEGLFTENFDATNIFAITTQVSASDRLGNIFQLGTDAILRASNGKHYRVTVSDNGVLETTDIS